MLVQNNSYSYHITFVANLCRVPTVGASVARHNYKKILVEKTSTFIGNNRNSGTQENRNAGQGYGSDIKYLTRTYLLSFYQFNKLFPPCATGCFGLHCLQSSDWTSQLFHTGVPSVIMLVKIASHSGKAGDDIT